MRLIFVAGLLLLLSGPRSSGAYETDQFTRRLEPIRDSTALLDEKVNDTIREIVKQWKGPRKDGKFVNAVYHKIGGHHWVDKIERWAMQSPEIDRIQPSRSESIYHGHPFWASRVAGIFGVGPTIKVNGQLIGSDKLGHFLSQGRKFYRRYQRRPDEAWAAEQSAFTERAIFGQLTTGSYSNADLVANYEGYLFYRSLFEADVVAPKPAILAWEGDHWVIQRPFTFADHVNAYWDEALNINDYDSLLYPYMKARLESFCGDYVLAPDRYQVVDEELLKQRYSQLQLRDTSDLRLDHLCVNKDSPGITGVAVQSQ